MGKKEINVLYFKLWNKTFIQQDLELIKNNYKTRVIDISEIEARFKNGRLLINWDEFNPIRLLIEIIRGMIWADVIFVWYTLFHSAILTILSKIFDAKIIVIAAGEEVAKEPEINYGLLNSKFRWIEALISINYSDLVIAVSKANKKEILRHFNPKKCKLVYNAVEIQKFNPKEKEKIVLTSGGIRERNLKKKGLETFVKSAKYLPETPFYLVGKHLDEEAVNYLKSIAPENVEITGFINFERLLDLMGRSKVYAQVSYHESFGVAVAEAMLCECVPVVTKRKALPEVVGDTGYFVPFGDPKETAKVIHKALNSNKGKSGRKRVEEKFSLEKRENELNQIIKEVYSN